MRNNRAFYTVAAITLLVCLFYGINVEVHAQTVQSPIPLSNPPRLVNDRANVIDAATESRMETMLVNLYQRANIEFAVVTVDTTGERDIFDYSLAVMRGWGIGSGTKPGLLLLIAVNDRKYFTQVGRQLEGDLPDSVVGGIGRQMREYFRTNNYSEGVLRGTQAFVATLAEKRGFSVEGIDQSYAYREPRQQRRTRGSEQRSGLSGCILPIIILVIIIFLLSSRGRGGGGGFGGGGCLNLLLLNTLLSGAGGFRSSGWSGGGFGGSGGGGGGGFGGFSGGGGDAGGGGAGGDW